MTSDKLFTCLSLITLICNAQYLSAQSSVIVETRLHNNSSDPAYGTLPPLTDPASELDSTADVENGFKVVMSRRDLLDVVWKEGPTHLEVALTSWPANITLVSMQAWISDSYVADLEGDTKLSLEAYNQQSPNNSQTVVPLESDNSSNQYPVNFTFISCSMNLQNGVPSSSSHVNPDGLVTCACSPCPRVTDNTHEKCTTLQPITVHMISTMCCHASLCFGWYLSKMLDHEEDHQSSLPQRYLEPHNLGRAIFNLSVSYLGAGDDPTIQTVVVKSISVSIIRRFRVIDVAFKIIIYVLVALATLGMGANIDIPQVKETLRRPKAPVIAMISQFTIMPLLAFAIVYLEGYIGSTALGFFCMGCSPGGGSSNTYTHLLGGNMTVSITMTLLSTILSIAMIPFWLYTLGSALPARPGQELNIPFLSILQSLALIIIPLGIGLLIKVKLPRVAKIIRKLLKIYMLIMVLILLTFGVYANLYIFQMFNARLVFTACMLPYGGFILGGLLAFACRFDWTMIKTIAIETGYQNTSVAFIIIASFLQSPDFELAATPLIAVAVMSPLPLFVASICYTIYTKCCNKNKSDADVEDVDDAASADKEMEDLKKTSDDSPDVKDIEADDTEIPPEYATSLNPAEESKSLMQQA